MQGISCIALREVHGQASLVRESGLLTSTAYAIVDGAENGNSAVRERFSRDSARESSGIASGEALLVLHLLGSWRVLGAGENNHHCVCSCLCIRVYFRLCLYLCLLVSVCLKVIGCTCYWRDAHFNSSIWLWSCVYVLMYVGMCMCLCFCPYLCLCLCLLLLSMHQRSSLKDHHVFFRQICSCCTDDECKPPSEPDRMMLVLCPVRSFYLSNLFTCIHPLVVTAHIVWIFHHCGTERLSLSSLCPFHHLDL